MVLAYCASVCVILDERRFLFSSARKPSHESCVLSDAPSRNILRALGWWEALRQVNDILRINSIGSGFHRFLLLHSHGANKVRDDNHDSLLSMLCEYCSLYGRALSRQVRSFVNKSLLWARLIRRAIGSGTGLRVLDDVCARLTKR